MSLDRLVARSLIPDLQRDIESRLSELELEAAALRNALKALRGNRSGSPGKKRDARQDLITAVRQQPGSRTSLLALAQRRSVDAVAETLDALERDGAVVRDGLGWRLVHD